MRLILQSVHPVKPPPLASINAMAFFPAFRRAIRFRCRAAIFLLLIGPLYIVPCLFRTFLHGDAAWAIGAAAFGSFGTVVLGVLTNDYRFAFGINGAAVAVELGLLLTGHDLIAVLWAIDLVPALVAIYFAQEFYLNMGD